MSASLPGHAPLTEGRASGGKQAWRPDIQGLRAVAVLVVVGFHAGLPVPGGFVGVDVFFVISGFVITGMLGREWARDGRISFARFYLRRFKRLTPALAVLICVTVILSAFVLSPLGTQQTVAKTAIGAVLLVANFVIASTTGGYFDAPAATNPLLNTWSLSVEEQFYLVFPLVLAGGWLCARRASILRFVPHALVALVAVASFALCVPGALHWEITGVLSDWVGFYGPLARAWEFAVGALLALCVGRLSRTPPWAATVAGVVGAAALVSALWLIGESTAFPGPWTLLPVGAALVLLAAGEMGPNPVTRALSWHPMSRVGDWSYSIYLWHWPLIAFAALIWPDNEIALLLAAAVSLVPALASFRWVEQPIRAIGGLSRRRMTGIIAATVAPPLALSSALWFAADQGLWLQPVRELTSALSLVHSGQASGCDGMIPQGARPDGQCVWNAGAGGPPVYLVGDSHAGHLSEAVTGAGVLLGRPVVVSTSNACPFLEGEWYVSFNPDWWNEQCRDYVTGTIDWLKSQPSGTVVVSSLAGTWLNPDYVYPAEAGGAFLGASEREALYRDRLRRTVVDLYQAGHDVVLVQDTPRGLSNPLECTTVAVVRGTCETTAPISAVLANREVDRQVIQSTADETGARVIDLLTRLCPDSLCSSRMGDLILYRDSDHLSVPASASLAPLFAEALSAAP